VWQRLEGLVVDMLVDTLALLILMVPLYVGQILEVLRPGSEGVRHFLAFMHEVAQVALVVAYTVLAAANLLRNWMARRR
jgi:hypothetical protein